MEEDENAYIAWLERMALKFGALRVLDDAVGFDCFARIAELTARRAHDVLQAIDSKTIGVVIVARDAEREPLGAPCGDTEYAQWRGELHALRERWRRWHWRDEPPYGLLTLAYLDDYVQAQSLALPLLEAAVRRVYAGYFCGACDRANPLERCAHCDWARYCDQVCLRRDWRHRAACRGK